jgi:hypothetical protein
MFFSFDDSDTDVNVWSLDGNNALIMVQEYLEATNMNNLIRAMAGEFTLMKAQVEVSEAALKGMDGLYSGKKLLVQMGEHMLEQEIFMFEAGSRSVALILQDIPDEEGENSKEYEEMRALVSETLSIRRSPSE